MKLLFEAGKCEENNKDPSRLGQSDRFTSEAKTRQTIRGGDQRAWPLGKGAGWERVNPALRPSDPRVDGDLWPCNSHPRPCLIPAPSALPPTTPTLPPHISCGDAARGGPLREAKLLSRPPLPLSLSSSCKLTIRTMALAMAAAVCWPAAD